MNVSIWYALNAYLTLTVKYIHTYINIDLMMAIVLCVHFYRVFQHMDSLELTNVDFGCSH